MPKPAPPRAGFRPMTPRQQRYVAEYLKDLCQTKAAIRAGYSRETAEQIGHALMRKPAVAAAIAKAMEARSTRTQITADMVLERWWQIATADRNEIVQYRRLNCRYCHGENHAFQWIDVEEFDRAVADAAKGKVTAPTLDGGLGFVRTAEPHADCPKCNGEGIGQTHAHDTRNLTGAARLIYDGVKETRDGFEIKTLDPAKALENVARHLGMFNDKLQLTGKDGGPLTMAQVTVDEVLKALPQVEDEC
jgi:phage terminase small subunit